MAFTTFTRAMAPALLRSTQPRVTIGAQGQLVLSRVLADKVGNTEGVRIAYDKEKRMVVLAFVDKIPEGHESEYFKARMSAKTHQLTVSGGSFLSWAEYDYKKTGTQTYDAKINEKKQVSFVLPAELPAPKAKVARKPRKATAPAAAPAVAVAAAGAGAPATPAPKDKEQPAEEDELLGADAD